MALTKYQKLVSDKAKYCAGKVTKATVKKSAAAYVKHAIATAKKTGASVTKRGAAAKKAATVVLQRGCKTSTVITGRKKKKAGAKRKSAMRK